MITQFSSFYHNRFRPFAIHSWQGMQTSRDPYTPFVHFARQALLALP